MRMTILAVGVALAVQAPTAPPAFEVATVKPASLSAITPAAIQSGRLRMGMNVSEGRVDIGFMSLTDLIRTAYDLKPYQIVGPDWMTSQRFDITAKLPDGATKGQVPAMLQALLAERFKLTVHRDKRDLPVYALIVGKDGPKLKEAAADADVVPKDAPPPTLVANGQSMTIGADGRTATVSGDATGPVRISMSPQGEHIEALKMTLPQLADLLAPMLDRPVLDMTELKGAYQVTLDIPLQDLMAMATRAAAAAGIAMPAGAALGAAAGAAAAGNAAGGGASAAPTASDPGGSSIFQIVQNLGLKLDARRAPADVIVVDHVEKTPSEN